MIKNSLSIDLETYTHIDFSGTSSKKDKDKTHLLQVTNYLLKLLDTFNTKITFFVVGEIYEWYPDLIRKIKSEGHEIGYQTHRHIILKTKTDLFKELKLSRTFLKKYKPIGFRAPQVFFRKEYFPILYQHGFKYDSSTYGTFNSKKRYSKVKEIPISLINFPWVSSQSNKSRFPKNLKNSVLQGIPYGSGLCISFFQKQIQTFINHTNRQNQPAILFIHPWQLSSYPKPNLIKNCYNLPKLLYARPIDSTLNYLLKNNNFVPLKELLNET